MTPGLKVLCANSTLVDTSSITGVLADAVVISTGTSGTLSYPELAGRTVYVSTVRALSGTGSAYNNRNLSFAVSYGPGYPQITYSPIGSGGDFNLNVFVLVR